MCTILGFSCARSHTMENSCTNLFSSCTYCAPNSYILPFYHNLFSNSNYEAPHYAISPNPATVLRYRSTYSPEHSQFVFPGYAFSERRVSTRDAGVSFCRTPNSSSAFYSICCYNHLNCIISSHIPILDCYFSDRNETAGWKRKVSFRSNY
jgi:hypothetical protein